MGNLGKTRDEKLSGWHRLFIVFAVVWTVSGTLFYFNFPWHEKEYIEKEQLNDVAETINIVFGLLNKKQDAGITFTIREEETFELLNKKKVLGLPKKKGPQVSHSNKKDLTFAEFMSSRIPNLTAELCSLDNVALSKYDKEERELIVKHRWHDLTELLISQYEGLNFKDSKRRYKLNLHEYHKEKRMVLYLFLLYWLAPIGLAYVMGRCGGWIIRGFRKDN